MVVLGLKFVAIMGDLKGSHDVDLKLLDMFKDLRFCFEMSGRAEGFSGELLLKRL